MVDGSSSDYVILISTNGSRLIFSNDKCPSNLITFKQTQVYEKNIRISKKYVKTFIFKKVLKKILLTQFIYKGEK